MPPLAPMNTTTDARAVPPPAAPRREAHDRRRRRTCLSAIGQVRYSLAPARIDWRINSELESRATTKMLALGRGGATALDSRYRPRQILPAVHDDEIGG